MYFLIVYNIIISSVKSLRGSTQMNNESVGKKIVEALKKQAESMDMENNASELTLFDNEAKNNEEFLSDVDISDKNNIFDDVKQEPSQDFFDEIESENERAFISEPIMQNSGMDIVSDNFELPSNIMVLKKLISQLPSGVSRHTGAQIIKQTMEALGISMKSVLQDAQQVQESLKSSARECQGSIQEYKKQILTLERQSQNYQKQYSALNDLISLFIQTTK